MEYILNINSDKDQERKSAQRQAFNSSIQSSCADFFKLLAVKTLKYPNIKFKFGVFDSFLLEVPEDQLYDSETARGEGGFGSTN